MVCASEIAVSRGFRSILAGLPIGAHILQGETLHHAVRPLEGFVPRILREIHPEWERECLDGIYPYLARKTGENEVEIVGACILISDQTVVPLHLRFQLANSTDEISWMECRIGQIGPQGMVRTPYKSMTTVYKLWAKFNDPRTAVERLDWAYEVTFGEQRT